MSMSRRLHGRLGNLLVCVKCSNAHTCAKPAANDMDGRRMLNAISEINTLTLTIYSTTIENVKGVCRTGLASMRFFYLDFKNHFKQDAHGADLFPTGTSSREKILEFVEWLSNDHSNLHCSHLSIGVTSRPEADLDAVLLRLASHTVSLHGERGQKDIANYIKWFINSNSKAQKWRKDDKVLFLKKNSWKELMVCNTGRFPYNQSATYCLRELSGV